ncbi:MAG: hypothetical protein H6834_08805 [Planctomycetes bacterium]|nr:hypothetical protein [Planctomycetota bacterium]
MPARLLAFLLASAFATLANAQTYEEANARYEECIHRLPFIMHSRGWEALAKSKDLRAMRTLMAIYTKPEVPEDPADQVRYMVAALATKYMNAKAHVDLYRTWRAEHDKTEDAWLWYRSLGIERLHGDVQNLVDVALNAKLETPLRAAAMEALAKRAEKAGLDVVTRLLNDKLPRKDEERAMLLESCASILLSQKNVIGTEAFKTAGRLLIPFLDDKKTPKRTKLVIGRFFAKIYNVSYVMIEADPWMRQLESGKARADSTKGDYARPTFFGIDAEGDRIAYVIDMSDSMLNPLSGTAKPKGPVTGKKPRERKKGDIPTADDIPWHLVNNRFDLAREHLKISLRQLEGKDKEFCVLWFGDGAGTLDACEGMTKATPKNIQRVIDELDAIQPGPKNGERPYGTLRGKTNLHGALHRAFKLKRKGYTKKPEYVDEDALMEGCDTIFVLSDGDPTWDDWDKVDQNYNEDIIGDPETRVRHESQPRLHYSGPYRDWNFLLDDAERLNLFRKAEIHCIGTGETQMSWLERLAALGMGKSLKVGS